MHGRYRAGRMSQLKDRRVRVAPPPVRETVVRGGGLVLPDAIAHAARRGAPDSWRS
jgi:hypothetical protein